MSQLLQVNLSDLLSLLSTIFLGFLAILGVLPFLIRPRITFRLDSPIYLPVKVQARGEIFTLNLVGMPVGNSRGYLRKTSHDTRVGASMPNHTIGLYWGLRIPSEIDIDEPVKDGKYARTAMNALEKYLAETSDLPRGLAEVVLIGFSIDKERNVFYFAGKPPFAKQVRLPEVRGGMQWFRLIVSGEDISLTPSPSMVLSSLAPDWENIRISVPKGKPRKLNRQERDRVLQAIQRHAFGQET